MAAIYKGKAIVTNKEKSKDADPLVIPGKDGGQKLISFPGTLSSSTSKRTNGELMDRLSCSRPAEMLTADC